MNSVERVTTDLAIANRILAEHGVLDEAGHVSVRHPLNPDHYLMAGSHGPTHILPHDLVVFALDGRPITEGKQLLCKERFAHAAVYEARPDIHAVLYACSEDILPFTISDTPFRPVIGQSATWARRSLCGTFQKHLVTAPICRFPRLSADANWRSVWTPRVVLMRGVGFLATGRTLNDLVRMSVYIPKNARSLASSLAIGKTRSLSQGETRARLAINPESNAMRRGWEYWARKAGCAHLMAE